jgi:hypothetical protein
MIPDRVYDRVFMYINIVYGVYTYTHMTVFMSAVFISAGVLYAGCSF